MYSKLVQEKKEALRLTKEEASYTKDVLDKTKEMAKLQTQIDKLALDDSREAQAKRVKLLEEMADLQDSLSEKQEDHAYDATVEMLDKSEEKYKEEADKRIEALEETISSEEKLYQLALQRIETGWDTLFQDLINWNTEAGSVINNEIAKAWEEATKQVQRYADIVAALAAYHKKVDSKMLATVEIPVMHSGGVVGSNVNPDEQLTMLEKGEIVLSKNAQKGLWKIVDFPSVLAEKFGGMVENIKSVFGQLPEITMPAQKAYAPDLALAGAVGSMVFNPQISVNINHSGAMTDADARGYGETIANTAMDKLYNAFGRKGVTGRNIKNLR